MRISNPEKVYFPEAGHTQRDLVGYYRAVAEGALGGASFASIGSMGSRGAMPSSEPMSGETIPAEPLRFGRWQSGGLNAAGFFVLLYIVSSAFFLTPLAVFFHAALFFSLPVIAVVWLKGAQVSGMQLWLAMVIPYLVAGFAVGLLWPLGRPVFWRAVRQMAIRLAVTMAVFIVPGAILVLRSGAH